MSKVWFITGAGSGIGAGAAKAALKAGDCVVATGRNVQKLRNALHEVASESLEIMRLDVSDEMIAPTLEARLKAVHALEELSKSTDGCF